MANRNNSRYFLLYQIFSKRGGVTPHENSGMLFLYPLTLKLKIPFKIVEDNTVKCFCFFFFLLFTFSEKIRFGISCELSARQAIHMKC